MTSEDWDVTAADEYRRSWDWMARGRRGEADPQRSAEEAAWHRGLARSARRHAERARHDDRHWRW